MKLRVKVPKLRRLAITNYDAIGMENMSMTVKNNIFAKSRLDASWGKLRQYITYKAESAGKLYVPVDYRGTTQICSQCGTDVPKELWDRTHKCICGFTVSRDYNSALEIKKRLIKEIGWEPSEYKLVEILLTAELLQDRSTSYASVKQEAPFLGLG